MSIGTDSTTNAINIGTAASSTRTTTIGNTTAASTLALKCGTGGYTLASATGTIESAQSTGEIRYAFQPAFNGTVAGSGLTNNVTGNGTVYTIGASLASYTIIFNQGTNFNSNGTFTAPVTGVYWLTGQLVDINIPVGGGQDSVLTMVTTLRTFYGTQLPTRNVITNYDGPNGWISGKVQSVCLMDAADTAVIKITDSGGAKTDSIINSDFYGYLVC